MKVGISLEFPSRKEKLQERAPIVVLISCLTLWFWTNENIELKKNLNLKQYKTALPKKSIKVKENADCHTNFQSYSLPLSLDPSREGTKQKRLTRQNNNFSQTRARLNLEFFFAFTFSTIFASLALELLVMVFYSEIGFLILKAGRIINWILHI